MALQYKVIPVTPLQQNCTIFWCDKTKEAGIIDPGGDLELIESFIADKKLTPTKILITHAHIDHAGATQDLKEKLNLEIFGPHKEDDFWIKLLPEQASRFGFASVRAFTPDRWLKHNDTITIGEETLYVYHCPGHTPGHVVFYSKSAELIQVGDVLFAGSIGRTDFPKGDHATLISSIVNNLWPLGNQVTFISGHGPLSTFEQERLTNPYVADSVLNDK